MPYKITLIPGDGIGPEVTEAARKVLEATGVKFDWELAYAGEKAQDHLGTPLPDYVLESIRRNKVAYKGPITTPVGYGFRSVNVALRKTLDLYACLRPCKSYPGLNTKFQDVNIVIVRENTEDLYAGIEFEKGTPGAIKLRQFIMDNTTEKLREDAGYSIKIISETGSRRIVKFAFEYARANNRKKVSAIHKANIMKFTDGLFLSVAREVAKEYPDIEFDDVIIDTLCMRLVRRPEQFDIIVLPNLYGDFISELCAGLIGGLGVAPGANIGDHAAVFEPTHGSAPKYAGKDMANPMAMIMSGIMMLRHLGEQKAAEKIEKAISKVLLEGRHLTYDLKSTGKGNAYIGTAQMADVIIETMGRINNA